MRASDNFVGRPLPGYDAGECVLRRDVAAALKHVQADLSAAGLALKVYDCYRPARAGRAMAHWAQMAKAAAPPNDFIRDWRKTHCRPRLYNRPIGAFARDRGRSDLDRGIDGAGHGIRSGGRVRTVHGSGCAARSRQQPRHGDGVRLLRRRQPHRQRRRRRRAQAMAHRAGRGHGATRLSGIITANGGTFPMRGRDRPRRMIFRSAQGRRRPIDLPGAPRGLTAARRCLAGS